VPDILKLGGSLLTLPDLFVRVRSLVSLLNTDRLLIIPGGGAAADEIRRVDESFQLSSDKAHWAAIATMSANASMLARLSGFLEVVKSRHDADHVRARGKVAILDTYSFLKNEEECSEISRLPALWDVTSDSIAAWIATRWPARRLILAKSCELDGMSVRQLVAHHKLDAWFPKCRGQVPTFWLNLRHTPLTLSAVNSESDIA
jgi:aspartokinase-like uncharacterized kinase